jgi:hypothetical protein
MADAYLHLSREDQQEVLGVAASRTGRPAHLLEKDVWVVWTLASLFESAFGKHLVFKGGTSLSKGYGAIRRFSEDIDVTYDIRAFAPELVQNAGDEALPPSNSQQARWSKAIRNKLPQWVAGTAFAAIRERLDRENLSVALSADNDCLYLGYTAAASGYGYTAPRIMVEFGARSTGEPCSARKVACDAAQVVPDIVFPVATPRVMSIHRTFWEKLTAIHVFCRTGDIKDRLARHWHDIYTLHLAGHAESALKNRAVADAVAKHKGWFFAAKDALGNPIDYAAVVNGSLQLVPEGATLDALAADYEKMVSDGLLMDEAKSFEELIEGCRAIQDRANDKQNRTAIVVLP